MKKHINTTYITNLFFSVAMLFSLTSCSQWLKCDTEDRIMEDSLYETTEGYYTALNGVYIELVNSSLYSGTYSTALADVLSQYFDTSLDGHSFSSLARFRKEAKRRAVRSTWGESYKMILNINKILYHCEQNGAEVLSERDLAVIKGEALGLRALLHFELFRIFGPIYSKSPAAKSIPYVDTDDPEVLPILKASVVASRIVEDLKAGLELLKKHDPVLTEGKFEQPDNFRNFLRYRNLRFNYYAQAAMLARVCMYLGYDYKDDALVYSQKVIDEASEFFTFTTRDEINNSTDISGYGADKILSSDILFAAYNVRRGSDIYEKYFSNTLDSKNLLAMSPNGYHSLYPEQGDLRAAQWSARKDVLGNDVFIFTKYKSAEIYGQNYPYMIPVIRMSEMYLIAAECYASKGETKKAFALLNVLRNARQTSSVDTNIMLHIEDEYAREFVGEGQLLWLYKRYGYSTIPSLYNRSRPDVNIHLDDYTFDFPQIEDGFRHTGV